MAASISGNKPASAIAQWAETWALDIYRYCRALLRSDADAEDVMQLVFLQAQLDAPRLEPHTSPKAWLLTIARHRCLDRLKMRERAPRQADESELQAHPSEELPIDQQLASSQAAAGLAECLGQLPDAARASVVLRYRDQLSYEQIEQLTGAKAGAHRVRVVRALASLRDCLTRKGVEW